MLSGKNVRCCSEQIVKCFFGQTVRCCSGKTFICFSGQHVRCYFWQDITFVKMEVKICKFHYHGHCKFGPNCRNLYTPETCVTTFWDWLTCPSRHPKPCKYHIQFVNCLFGSSCSYLHVAKENEIEALKKDLTNILALVNAKEKEIQVTMLAPAPVCAPGVATGQPTKGHPGPYGERWQVQFAPSEALLFNNDHTKITKPPPLHCLKTEKMMSTVMKKITHVRTVGLLSHSHCFSTMTQTLSSAPSPNVVAPPGAPHR